MENERGIVFAVGFPLSEGNILERPLTIPVVIDPASPKGFPIAMTVSPTLIPGGFATVRGTSLPAGTPSSFRTAKSE